MNDTTAQESPHDDRSAAAGTAESDVGRQLQLIRISFWAAIGIGLAILLLWLAGPTVLIVFAGILCGTVLHGLADWLRGHAGISLVWSLTVICLALAAAAALAGWWIGPQVADQLAQLSDQLSSSWDSVIERLRTSGLGGLAQSLTPENVLEQLRQASGVLMSAASGALSFFGGLVVVAFIGIYTAMAPDSHAAGLLWLMPEHRRNQTRELLSAAGAAVKSWFLARALSMATVGLLTGTGLWLIGMPLSVALGTIAAVFSFVPYLGPIAAGVPAVLIGLAQSPSMALYVVLLYAGIQTVESYIITPQLVKRAISLPPAAILMVQLFFGVFFGIIGVAFASPASAVAVTVIRKTLRRPPLQEDTGDT